MELAKNSIIFFYIVSGLGINLVGTHGEDFSKIHSTITEDFVKKIDHQMVNYYAVKHIFILQAIYEI